MFCENCGAAMENNVAFCPNCGQKVEVKENNEQPKLRKGVGFATNVVSFVVNAYVVVCAIAGFFIGGQFFGDDAFAILGCLLAAAISYVTTLQIRVMLNISRNSEIIANNLYYLSRMEKHEN